MGKNKMNNHRRKYNHNRHKGKNANQNDTDTSVIFISESDESDNTEQSTEGNPSANSLNENDESVSSRQSAEGNITQEGGHCDDGEDGNKGVCPDNNNLENYNPNGNNSNDNNPNGNNSNGNNSNGNNSNGNNSNDNNPENYYPEEGVSPFIKRLAIITVVAFFAGIILIPVFPDKTWIGLSVALPCVILLILATTISRIRFFIRLLRRPKQTLEESDIGVAVSTAKEIAHHYKKGYNRASKKHKVLLLLILGSFLTVILLMIVGVAIASYFPSHKTVGFILMGISGGGMALFILTLIVISKKNG